MNWKIYLEAHQATFENTNLDFTIPAGELNEIYIKQVGYQPTGIVARPTAVGDEILIADCSQQLSQLSAVAGLDSGMSAQAIVNLWQTNLDFMKWWLENRRSKTQNK